MPDSSISPSARNATVIIATVLVGAVIWWLRAILTPLALAFFMMLIIDGQARVMTRRIPRFPRLAALPLAVVLTTLVVMLAAYEIATHASSFVSQLIAYAPQLNGLIQRIGQQLGMDVPPTVDQLLTQMNLPHYLASVAGALKDVLSGAVFVFIYLIFLFISRQSFETKARALFATGEGFEQARAVFVRIREGVERYVWVQTLMSLAIASGSYALMRIVGLHNSIFWAFLIFVFSYVPILGGAIGIFLPPLFALVQFDTHWQALVLLFGAETIHFLVGNFIAPRMQGVSLNVDPVVVVLSLAFWGAIWGVPGMFLSTPLTVVAIVVLIQFPSTRWVAVLLSRDGAPETSREAPASPGS